jgi:hypothetical protein
MVDELLNNEYAQNPSNRSGTYIESIPKSTSLFAEVGVENV